MKYNKEYSTLVMNHAIARAEFEGINQKGISSETEIRTETITRAKQGKQSLTTSEIDILIKRFGSPKNKEGLYVEAVVFDTLDDFTKNHSRVHVDNFHKELATWFCNDQIKSALAESLAPVKLENSENDSSLFHRDEIDLHKSKKWLDKYLREADYLEWYEECQRLIKDFDSNTTNTNHSSEIKLPILASGPWSKVNTYSKLNFLFALGYLIEIVKPDYSFSNNQEYIYPSTVHTLSPVVITGDIVYSFSGDEIIKSELKETVENPLGNGFSGKDYLRSDDLDFGMDRTISFKHISYVQVDLYLNSKMDYRLLITVDFHKSFVIKIINPLHVLEECNKIRKYFSATEHELFTLKQGIAEKGGYIPGAIVL